jgi:hypothetical protein
MRARQFKLEGNLLTFRSSINTETEANNIVRARIHSAKKPRRAVVILPHWNAPMWAYQKFGQYLARLGVTAVELCLPYQGERNRSGAPTSDHFLSANLGRTIRSVRQAVLDAKDVLDWLEESGHKTLGMIGVSLGSCIAGLVSAHDTRVTASALLLTAGDFAEVVWTGRATQHIRSGLAGGISLPELQQVWSIISTGTYVRQLARSGHRTLIISASRDRVVAPSLTRRFVEELRGAGGRPAWRILPCGHYSLALFPFSAMAFFLLARFLRAIDANEDF